MFLNTFIDTGVRSNAAEAQPNAASQAQDQCFGRTIGDTAERE